MSHLGKWDNWYAGVEQPQSYGEDRTYRIAATILEGLDVEDWGCGKGYFQSVFPGKVIGVDGTETPFSHKIADLTEYTSSTPGLHMRHVLEHNLEWEKILANAVESFTERMVLTIFTPMAEKTEQIAWNSGPEVPDMAFAHEDIMRFFDEDTAVWFDHKTATQYGTERVYSIGRF
jgi:hypothetical protein